MGVVVDCVVVVFVVEIDGWCFGCFMCLVVVVGFGDVEVVWYMLVECGM